MRITGGWPRYLADGEQRHCRKVSKEYLICSTWDSIALSQSRVL